MPKSDISKKIQQTDFPKNLQHQLETELRDLVDVCDLRGLVAQTKNCLASIGGKPEDNLLQLMNSLHFKPKMEIKVFRNITLQYVNSLLIFLGYIRAKRMILNKQNPFNDLPEKYQKEIEVESPHMMDENISNLLHKVPPDVIAVNLFGFIDFISNSIADEANEDTPLKDGLYNYLEELDSVEDLNIISNIYEYFDSNIKYKHAVKFFEKIVLRINQI